MKQLWGTCIGMIVLMGMALQAEDVAKEITPKLEPKKEILEKIANLKANQGVMLPGVTIMEDMGDFAKGWHQMKKFGPGPRDYSNKLVWMADRKRAFFCGANHGSPTRFNDAWEYDLASNTWVLLYTPDYNDRGEITDYDKATLVLQDGWLRTKKGGPAHPAHTWWGLTYDPHIKGAVWFCAWPPYRLQAKLDAIGAKKEDLFDGPPIWIFYPETKKWEPMKTEKPWPKNEFGSSLEYVPDLKMSIWQSRQSSWLLDPVSKSWKNISNGNKAVSIESIIYYDIKRKIFIAQNGPTGKSNDRFTLKAAVKDGGVGAWEEVLKTEEAPLGHDARSVVYYDPISNDGLLFENGPRKLWSYNPDNNKWVAITPEGDAPDFGKEHRVLSYFDIERNVYVVIGYGKVWCYRYKVAENKK